MPKTKQTNKKRRATPVALPLVPRKERRRLSEPVDRAVRLRMPGDPR